MIEDQSLPVHPKHAAWLEEMVDTYDLADTHKALRILIEYAIQEGDLDTIFTEIRCTKC